MTRAKPRSNTRRGRGDGSGIYPHPTRPGWFYSKVTLSDGSRKTIYGRSREACAAARDDLTSKVRKNQLPKPDEMTLGTLLERWLTALEPDLSDRSQELYSDTLRLYVPKSLTEKRVQELKKRDFSDLMTDLARKGLSYSTRSKVVQHLHRALEKAIDDELLLINPARGVRVRPTLSDRAKLENRAGKALTDLEMDLFLNAAESDPLYSLFYTMFSLGLRRSEALGLRWSDLDFSSGKIRVQQGVKIVRNKTVIGPLKTPRSRRTLLASPDLLAVLKARREAQARDRELMGSDWTNSGLVFTSHVGTPVCPRSVNRTISRIVATLNAERLGVAVPHGFVPFARHETKRFTVGTAALAQALGVTTNTVLAWGRESTRKGAHWVPGEKRNSGRPVYLWTREGALLLAKRAKTEQAQAFAHALETFVLPPKPEGQVIRHFGSHAARHTNLTGRLRDGVPLEVVASIAGHSRPTVTLDIYRTVFEEEKTAVVYSITERRKQTSRAQA